jgi:hypothetical protein
MIPRPFTGPEGHLGNATNLRAFDHVEQLAMGDISSIFLGLIAWSFTTYHAWDARRSFTDSILHFS